MWLPESSGRTNASPSNLCSNLELKVRLNSLPAARRIARHWATRCDEPQHQLDTYFRVTEGRLKLREINAAEAELIWYVRPDLAAIRASHYRRVPVTAPEALKLALTAALGVRIVVEKRREIFWFHNVRIHLDEVAGLGTFLEFEAVLRDLGDAAPSHARLDTLQAAFAITPEDTCPDSYHDLAERIVERPRQD